MQNLRRLLEKNPMEVVWPVVIFAVTFAVAWLIRAAVLRALRAWAARSKSPAGSVLSGAVRGMGGPGAAGALDYLPDHHVYAGGGRPGAQLRGPGAGRAPGDHAERKPGEGGSVDPWPGAAAQERVQR